MAAHDLTRNEAILLVELLGAEADRTPAQLSYLKRSGTDPTGSMRQRAGRRERRCRLLARRIWEAAFTPTLRAGCPGYSPDWQAMGDCHHCGRTEGDHKPRPQDG